MSNYITYGHAKTSLRYHLIFSTKFRKKCLIGIEKELERIIRDVAESAGITILELGMDKNHIHLLVSFNPSTSISSAVRTLKQGSTFHIYRIANEHMRAFYWKRNYLWTRGYFCSTIGEVSEETISNYIRNQG